MSDLPHILSAENISITTLRVYNVRLTSRTRYQYNHLTTATVPTCLTYCRNTLAVILVSGYFFIARNVSILPHYLLIEAKWPYLFTEARWPYLLRKCGLTYLLRQKVTGLQPLLLIEAECQSYLLVRLHLQEHHSAFIVVWLHFTSAKYHYCHTTVV